MEKPIKFKEIITYESTFYQYQAVLAFCFIAIGQLVSFSPDYEKVPINFLLTFTAVLCIIFVINLIAFFHLIGRPLVSTKGALGWFKVKRKIKHRTIKLLLYFFLLIFYNPITFFLLDNRTTFLITICGIIFTAVQFFAWRNERERVEHERAKIITEKLAAQEKLEQKKKDNKELVKNLIDSEDWDYLVSLFGTQLDYSLLLKILHYFKGPQYIIQNHTQLVEIWEMYTSWEHHESEEAYRKYCHEELKKITADNYVSPELLLEKMFINAGQT